MINVSLMTKRLFLPKEEQFEIQENSELTTLKQVGGAEETEPFQGHGQHTPGSNGQKDNSKQVSSLTTSKIFSVNFLLKNKMVTLAKP